MFKKIIPISARSLPIIFKLTSITLGLWLFKQQPFIRSKQIKCSGLPFRESKVLQEVIPQIIRIEKNGEVVGYAYFHSSSLLVTASQEIIDKKQNIQSYDFFIGDNQINSKFKLIGKFENLAFIQTQSEEENQSFLQSSQSNLFTPVHIVQKRSYFSIHNGYYVGNDSGFGIINGEGEVGNLVLNNEGTIGIITQVGRDEDNGFVRMIMWKDIDNIVKRLKNNKSAPYLGISVVAVSEKDGVSIVRVSPNSPFSSQFFMGDIITQVNGHSLRNPEDLIRIIMISGEKVDFKVQTTNKNNKIVTLSI